MKRRFYFFLSSRATGFHFKRTIFGWCIPLTCARNRHSLLYQRGVLFVTELTLSAFSSKRAKTGEVLQQAVAALNASNYSILLFCQLQLINLIFPVLKMFVFSPSYDLAESHIKKRASDIYFLLNTHFI